MARRAGYKAGYITHYSGPKAGGGRTNGVKLVVRGYYEIPRGATGYQKLTKISKPPPSATRPPLQRLHGRHLTRVPTSTQAGAARVAESLIGRTDPFIRAAELSQFDHKIRRLRYAPGRRGMPVTPITMQRYPPRSPGGTGIASAARHDADRCRADRNGGAPGVGHPPRPPKSPADNGPPPRGRRVRHGETGFPFGFAAPSAPP